MSCKAAELHLPPGLYKFVCPWHSCSCRAHWLVFVRASRDTISRYKQPNSSDKFHVVQFRILQTMVPWAGAAITRVWSDARNPLFQFTGSVIVVKESDCNILQSPYKQTINIRGSKRQTHRKYVWNTKQAGLVNMTWWTCVSLYVMPWALFQNMGKDVTNALWNCLTFNISYITI